MGESADPALTPQFDRRLRLEFRGATLTSDVGPLAVREFDDALSLTEVATTSLHDSRGRNVQHRLVPLLRQSLYSPLAGYEDTNPPEADGATRPEPGHAGHRRVARA